MMPASCVSSRTAARAIVASPSCGVAAAEQDVAAPGAVRRERRIGVRLVLEGCRRDRQRRVQPVLGAVRGRDRCVEVGERIREALGLAGEHALVAVEVEESRHEVLFARVLFEAAHEVADGGVELAGVHDGRVEQQAVRVLAHGCGLRGRHAEQHLELDAALDPAPTRGEQGEREVEQVVTGDADPHRRDVGGVERGDDHALVVGVGRALARPGGERPAVHRRVDALHGEVRALDDAHLDAGAARGHASLRPRGRGGGTRRPNPAGRPAARCPPRGCAGAAARAAG